MFLTDLFVAENFLDFWLKCFDLNDEFQSLEFSVNLDPFNISNHIDSASKTQLIHE